MAAAPPPMPRSPPKYPDFCGRRRLQLDVQVMNREIGFLEEELQSLEGIQPASRSCKEVNEFVGTNPDPLIPIKKRRSGSCRIWKWLRSKLCFIPSSICCSSWCSTCCSNGCSLGLERLSCGCPHLTSWWCCDSQCGCCSCNCCKVSCCRPSWCCSKASSCCRQRCCSCKVPSCCCKDVSCCCKDVSCCCRPGCCCLPRLSCPGYSCGCVWSCPRCTGVQLCPTCTKTSCVSGCEC